MHPHNLTLALAAARTADVRRAATHNTATTPPRRHLHAPALVALAAITGLIALAPTGALAQPMRDTATPATEHVHARQATHAPQSLQSPDARDAAEGRGAFNSPDVVVVQAQPQTRPALANGIDWADAGIGAGSVLAMSLLALGGMLLIRHHRRAAHDTVDVAPGTH